MSEELKNAPAEEVKQTEEVVEAPKEQESTVGDILNVETEEKKSDDVIPLHSFIEMKKENKQLQKDLKELRKIIEEGATKKEVVQDIQELSEKHGVDANFLQDLATTLRAESKKEMEEELTSKLKPLTDKEKTQKIDELFNQHFSKAMEKSPEYEGVVNKEVIKSLSLNPANKNKTFNQLIDEAYGHLVVGKRTMESSNTKVSRDTSGTLDVDKATRDTEYFKQIMSDPKLKKEYNEAMVTRLRTMV